MLNTSAISTAEARFDNTGSSVGRAKKNQAGLRLRRIGRLGRPDLPGRGGRRSASSSPKRASAWSMAAARRASWGHSRARSSTRAARSRPSSRRPGRVDTGSRGCTGSSSYEDAVFRKREMHDAADIVLVSCPAGSRRCATSSTRLMPASLPASRLSRSIVFDIGGFWQPLLALIEHMENQHLHASRRIRHAYDVCRTLDDVLAALWRSPYVRTRSSETVSIEATPRRSGARPTHHLAAPPRRPAKRRLAFAVYEVQPG